MWLAREVTGLNLRGHRRGAEVERPRRHRAGLADEAARRSIRRSIDGISARLRNNG
jgi:hypothetical protein